MTPVDIRVWLGIIGGSTLVIAFFLGSLLGQLETTISGKLEKIKWKLDNLNKTLKELEAKD